MTHLNIKLNEYIESAVRLYRVLGERLRNTTALSQNIQILINLNVITTLHELHFVGNGSIYVSKSCRHANHNTAARVNSTGVKRFVTYTDSCKCDIRK